MTIVLLLLAHLLVTISLKAIVDGQAFHGKQVTWDMIHYDVQAKCTFVGSVAITSRK